MDGHARALADGVQPLHDGVRIAVSRRNHLSMDIRRHAAHHVVDRRHDRNRLFHRIRIREFDRDLTNRWQPLVDDVGTEMIELQQHVVLVRAAAATFLDFLVHRPAHDVARCQIFQIGRVTLHEPLTARVQQNAALTANALGDQHAGAGDTRWMELPEFHVLEWQSGASRHAETVPRIDERVRRCGENPPRTAGGEDRDLRLQDHRFAGFHFERRHARDGAVPVDD